MSKSTSTVFMLASALAFVLAGPASGQSSDHVRRHRHHRPLAEAPVVMVPPAASGADYSRDSDGLSRDNEDCNKGCIDKTN